MLKITEIFIFQFMNEPSKMAQTKQNKQKVKQKAGGKRDGSGRKGKFSETTKPVSFKCPISKVEEFKEYVNAKLSEWSVK